MTLQEHKDTNLPQVRHAIGLFLLLQAMPYISRPLSFSIGIIFNSSLTDMLGVAMHVAVLIGWAFLVFKVVGRFVWPFVCMALLFSIGSWSFYATRPIGVNPFALSATESLFDALLMIALIGFLIRKGGFHKRTSLRFEPCPTNVYLAAAGTASFLFPFLMQLVAYSGLAVFLGSGESFPISLIDVIDYNSPFSLTLTVLIWTGLAITTELAFRGFILQGLLARFRPMASMALTAAMYAIPAMLSWVTMALGQIYQVLTMSGHLMFFPQMLNSPAANFMMLFPMGLYLGYLVVRTKSLYPAIVAHAIGNLSLLSIVILQRTSNSNLDTAQILRETYPPMLVAALAILAVLGLYALHRLTASKNADVD